MVVADPPDLSARLEQVRTLPVADGHMSVPVLQHGTMELRLFRPVEPDPQTPHDRDELYLVATGTAVLLRSSPRSPFEEAPLLEDAGERIELMAGDAAVVPAGTPHRFVEISPDFTTWMVFWGPEGGEPA